MSRLMAFLIIGCACWASAAAQQRGAKGGCYILRTSRKGKTYKQYLPKERCGAAGAQR